MNILLRQKCGPGNQLFQYAAGLFYAKKYGASLEVIREPDHIAAYYNRPWPFILSKLCIYAPVRDLTFRDRLMCSASLIKKPVAAHARFLFRTAVYRPHYLTDYTFLPELPIPYSTKNLYLEGFFQAYKYAQDVEQRLRAEFLFRSPAVGKNHDMLNRISAVENSVSVHIRRGDNINSAGGPQVLPHSYQLRAMQTLIERLRNPTFFVFSNDISFARENMPKGENIVFVDHNDEANGHEDLRLMS